MMSLRKRIERLENTADAGDFVHMQPVPYVPDDVGQAESKRQALERSPAPKGTKLTVCLIDYSSMD